MENMAIWFGLLGGVASAAHVAAAVVTRVRRIRTLHGLRRRKLRDAVQVMRDKAKITLDLRREERSMERELEDLASGIDRGEETADQARAGSESQVYVVDERRYPGDSCFVLTVRHPRFGWLSRNAPPELVESWREGRRYLVWAGADKLAEAKTVARFPAEKGYIIGPPEPFQGRSDEL